MAALALSKPKKDPAAEERRERIKLVAELLKGAPTFGGEHAEYFMFRHALGSYLTRNGPLPGSVELGVAMGCLEGAAKKHMGGLPDQPTSMTAFWTHMDSHYSRRP